MAIDAGEYLRRCKENIDAIRRLERRELSPDEEEKIGVMIARQMLAEQKFKARTQK